MKNSVKTVTIITVLILGITSMGFSQDVVRLKKTKTLMFDGESKKAEVKVKTTAEYNYLTLKLKCSLLEGDVTIEIFDPSGEKKGIFTVKSDKTTEIGDNTEVEEKVSASMEKVFSHPLEGDWIIRATPISAKGKTDYIISLGYEPRIDMMDLQNLLLR